MNSGVLTSPGLLLQKNVYTRLFTVPAGMTYSYTLYFLNENPEAAEITVAIGPNGATPPAEGGKLLLDHVVASKKPCSCTPGVLGENWSVWAKATQENVNTHAWGFVQINQE